MDCAIRWINHHLVDSEIGFAMTFPLQSNLSGGWRYPSFKQLRPDDFDKSGQQLGELKLPAEFGSLFV